MGLEKSTPPVISATNVGCNSLMVMRLNSDAEADGDVKSAALDLESTSAPGERGGEGRATGDMSSGEPAIDDIVCSEHFESRARYASIQWDENDFWFLPRLLPRVLPAEDGSSALYRPRLSHLGHPPSQAMSRGREEPRPDLEDQSDISVPQRVVKSID